MKQKIFDVKGREIWELFPEKTYKIVRGKHEAFLFDKEGECFAAAPHYLIKIDWKDKKEIIRPVNYNDVIGCVCKFSMVDIDCGGYIIGVLKETDKDTTSPFHMEGGGWFEYCEPVKKSELKFYED